MKNTIFKKLCVVVIIIIVICIICCVFTPVQKLVGNNQSWRSLDGKVEYQNSQGVLHKQGGDADVYIVPNIKFHSIEVLANEPIEGQPVDFVANFEVLANFGFMYISKVTFAEGFYDSGDIVVFVRDFS